jgi:hypothetical protein
LNLNVSSDAIQSNPTPEFDVFPNPNNLSDFALRANHDFFKPVNYQLFDAIGHEVGSGSLGNLQANQEVRIQWLPNHNPGIYLLKIKFGPSSYKTVQLIKL